MGQIKVDCCAWVVFDLPRVGNLVFVLWMRDRLWRQGPSSDYQRRGWEQNIELGDNAL
jgi:hypothetical protein